MLHFKRFDVEVAKDCTKDNVTVTDTVTGKQLFMSCGEDPPGDVISSSNRLSVVFRTDDSITRSGFVITYTARKRTRGKHIRLVHSVKR